MSMVRFAQLCDQCGKRSPEYSAWAHCRECSDDACRTCCPVFDDETRQGLCTRCAVSLKVDAAKPCNCENNGDYCDSCYSKIALAGVRTMSELEAIQRRAAERAEEVERDSWAKRGLKCETELTKEN